MNIERLKARVSILQAAIGAIVGVIGILIFAQVYGALNTNALSAGAVALLQLVDLLLAAVLVVGIVVLGFSRMTV